MKTLKFLSLCLVALSLIFASCESDKPAPPNFDDVLEDGLYIIGSATSNEEPAAKAVMEQGLNESDDNNAVSGLWDKYIALEANKSFYITKKSGVNLVNYGAGELETVVTDGADYTISGANVIVGTYANGAAAFTVPESGLYQVVVYEPESKVIIIPVKWQTNNMGEPYELVASDFNKESMTFTLTDVEVKNNNFKFKNHDGWKYPVTPDIMINCNYGAFKDAEGNTVAFNFTGVENNLGVGGSDIAVPSANRGVYTVELKWTLAEKNSHTAKLTKTGDVVLEYPETMYMIGQDFGAWDWNDETIAELIPVNGIEGAFWCVRYFTAENGFKWCATKAWSGDFDSLSESIGFTTSGGNAFVPTDGLYVVYMDMAGDRIAIEPATVYGMGDAFGGWDSGQYPFTINGDKMSITTSASGELRMYADASIAAGDWWQKEFIILDGKIEYRGNGGDQTRVPVTAGQTITLDFNAGTGTIQ